MTETIIKRAIGVALFASILVVVVPWLFDGSGDVLTTEPPTLVEVHSEKDEPLEQIAITAREDRIQLLEAQRTARISRDEAGRVVSESPILVPLLEPETPVEETGDVIDGQGGLQSRQSLGELAQQNVDASGQGAAAPQAHSALEEQPEPEPAPQPKPEPKPEPKPKPKPEPEAEDKLATFIAGKQGDWVVQVGLFSQPGNAEKLKARLSREINERAFVKRISINSNEYDGVFAGPYTRKSEAESARDRLEEKLGIKPYVKSRATLN